MQEEEGFTQIYPILRDFLKVHDVEQFVLLSPQIENQGLTAQILGYISLLDPNILC